MSEEEKCREAFERAFSGMHLDRAQSGLYMADSTYFAWQGFLAAWNLRQQAPGAIRVIGERLRADTFEHCTADPMFLVQKKRRIYGFDQDYSDDRIAWVDSDGEADDETASALEKEWNETGDEPDGWTRTGYADEWEHVTTYVTKEAAEAFAASKGDHYRVYVDSGCRNSEWQALREYLMSLAAPKPEDVK